MVAGEAGGGRGSEEEDAPCLSREGRGKGGGVGVGVMMRAWGGVSHIRVQADPPAACAPLAE